MNQDRGKLRGVTAGAGSTFNYSFGTGLVVLLLLAACTTIQTGPGRGAEGGANTEDGVTTVNVPSADRVEVIRVNQLGYLPERSKIAIVVVNGADAETFSVRNIRSGRVLFEGSLSAPMNDSDSGDTVRHADFSPLSMEGRYVLEVPGLGRSLPFDIDNDVYHDLIFHVGRSYTLQRSATEFSDPVTGFHMRAGHLQDREARLHFSDPFHSKGDVRNVIGGWYDAGDFGMYMPSSAVTVAQLLLAYETNPDGFYVGQLAFPHDIERSVAGMPDVLEEVRFNLQWMLRMQRSDGAVYHKKAGLRWPGERTPAWQDRQNRYVFGLSSSSTAQFVGATALAARVYRAFDPDFADTLLEAAQAAFAYLSDNPTPSFREDPQQDAGSGPYRDEEDAEERFWAAAELFKTTGDLEFERHISDHHGELLDSPTPFVTWFNSLGLAHWAYLTAADADPEQKSRVRSALLESADRIVERVEGSGYRSALAAKHYTWASAKNALALGTVLMMANHVAPDSTYRIAAMDQIHYVLGRNANSYSYVTGLGTRSPGFVHHRTQRATGVEIPGLLVGGPNKRGGDPLLNTLLKNDDPAPAKAYLDRYGSWSSNEYAIDYNAALFLLTAQVIAAE